MSIIDSADLASEPLIRPEKLYEPFEKPADICIVTFSGHAYKQVLNHYYSGNQASRTVPGGGRVLLLSEQRLAFCLSPIGAPAAGMMLHDIHVITGATRFIVFGSCGALDSGLLGKFIIPTEAYRDEGLSYHYCPPDDFITIKNAGRIESFFRKENVSFTAGKVWTTDAVYMETRDKIRRRREAGCVCVDMECSGLQAVSDYLGLELYIFFFAGDILGEEWDPGDLADGKEQRRQADALSMAFRLAETLS